MEAVGNERIVIVFVRSHKKKSKFPEEIRQFFVSCSTRAVFFAGFLHDEGKRWRFDRQFCEDLKLKGIEGTRAPVDSCFFCLAHVFGCLSLKRV